MARILFLASFLLLVAGVYPDLLPEDKIEDLQGDANNPGATPPPTVVVSGVIPGGNAETTTRNTKTTTGNTETTTAPTTTPTTTPVPQTFPRGNFSFVSEGNYTEQTTTPGLPEARATTETTDQFTQKPAKWERYRRSDYWFTESTDIWFNCRYECKQLSSDLVTITDRKELEFIQNKTKTGDYFIGLTYAADQNKWLWIDGTELKSNLFTMRPRGMNDECATITARELKPVSCYQESHCICERK